MTGHERRLQQFPQAGVPAPRRDSVTISGGPKVLALSADGRRAYVTHPRGSLTMIDVPSMRVLRTIPLGGTPDGVAVVEPRVVPGER